MLGDTDRLDIEAARTELYELTEDESLSLADQQRAALSVGCRYLGVENGHIKRLDDPNGDHRIVASTDPTSDWIPEDMTLDAAGYCETAVQRPDALAIEDAVEQGWDDNPGYTDHGVACYLGTDILVGGETYGTVCFVSRTPVKRDFDSSERMFVELLAQLLGRGVEERRYAGQLERSRSKYETLVETGPDAVLLVDTATGRIAEANAAAAELTGYPEAILTEKAYDDLIPAADDVAWFAAADEPRERLPDGDPLFVHDRAGNKHPVTVTADTIQLDGREYAHVIVRNISERRERERRAEAILDQTHQFTGLLSPDGTLLEANRTALEFAGLDRAEAVGRPFPELPWWTGDTDRQERLRDAIDRAADGEFVRYETEVQGVDGPRVIDFSLRPVRDDSGNVELLIPEGRDISERVRRERQLDVLARLLRHNFRNDMTVVRGYADMLTERLSGRSRELAVGLAENVDRLLGLTETYRETVDLVSDPPEPTDIDLSRALHSAVDRVRAEHSAATVGVDCPPDLRGRAIPEFGRAIEELVSNSVIHGGDDARVTVSAEPEADSVLVRIVDEGPGIPEAEANILRGDQSVDPLAHGTGMGLWLVYWLATLSGGEIAVTRTGDGTSIDIRLETPD